MRYLNIILRLMKNSVITKGGKESSTRIIAYTMSAIIILFSLVFVGIEITAAVIALKTKGVYVISNELMIAFGSLLAHQLTLLGVNKNSETQLQKKELENKKKENEEL